jgi:hypothetical protein
MTKQKIGKCVHSNPRCKSCQNKLDALPSTTFSELMGKIIRKDKAVPAFKVFKR